MRSSRRGCGLPTPLEPGSAREIEALYAHSEKVRALTPAFVKTFIVDRDARNDGEPAAEPASPPEEDFARLLVGHAAWYVEWPHIDGRFLALYPTLPGFVRRRP